MIQGATLCPLINRLNDQVVNYFKCTNESLVIREAIFDSILYRYINSFNEVISTIKNYLIGDLGLPEIDYVQKSVIYLSCKHNIILNTTLKDWLLFLKIKNNIVRFIDENTLTLVYRKIQLFIQYVYDILGLKK